ncbi:MIP18 family protein galla-2-like [Homarus americanus]|uniref:MIP18 family protein galla-2-like n=1 Tax=Homarus americanus TaxID=6706 RepID=UPI001C462777|nr:MIP18 family protein galla-2-like [Homarus americanus]XP_042221403.1 MIP18 family protein galla-2-like [Homarus americanus]
MKVTTTVDKSKTRNAMSGNDRLENINPLVFAKAETRVENVTDWDDEVYDPFDAREVFDLVRNIRDPEHPLSLEELNVVSERQCEVSDEENSVMVHFTPTIPHCSMASLIGLSIRLKLFQALPARIKVDVRITPGTHSSEHAINKQLSDKERVAAALENPHLLEVINKCLNPQGH